MTRKIAPFILVFGFFTLLTGQIYPDQRTGNIDCFILLDKSRSMVGLIDGVVDYVNNEIIEKTLMPGDYIKVLLFYGQTEPLLSKRIESDTSIRTIRQQISRVRADGFYTDIGNALDTLKQVVDSHDSKGRPQHLLLITDGIQEAPPESIYYSPRQPDPEFNHAFMENSKVIKKQGWKIHVLGIGLDTAAIEVAEAIGGTFSVVDESLPEDDLRESTREFLGAIRLEGQPEIRIRNTRGDAEMTLFLSSSGYPQAREVLLESIYLQTPEGRYRISGQSNTSIEPDSTGIFNISASIPTNISSEKGELEFIFRDHKVFTPGIVAVTIQYPGFMARNWLTILIILGAVVLLFLIVLFIKALASRTGSSKMDLAIVVGDGKEQVIRVKDGANLFISEGISGLQVSLNKGGEVLGEISCRLNQAVLKPLLDERFAGSRIGGNILEKTIRVKDRFGSLIALKISRK